jgi:hypothetical protein
MEQTYDAPWYVPCAPTGAQNAPGKMSATGAALVVVAG